MNESLQREKKEMGEQARLGKGCDEMSRKFEEIKKFIVDRE